MKLPNVKKPCVDCPFREVSAIDSLGGDRMTEILQAESFVCHHNKALQCAGHMLIRGMDNAFVRTAARLRIPLKLSGRELVFESVEACIEHHGRFDQRQHKRVQSN